jgi:hypothetical protein
LLLLRLFCDAQGINVRSCVSVIETSPALWFAPRRSSAWAVCKGCRWRIRVTAVSASGGAERERRRPCVWCTGRCRRAGTRGCLRRWRILIRSPVVR